MNYIARQHFENALRELKAALPYIEDETNKAHADGAIPSVILFDGVRETLRDLDEILAPYDEIVRRLGEDIIPTLFQKERIDKTTNIQGLGRVTISDRWKAYVVPGKKDEAYAYVPDLITKTLNFQTLSAYAKAEAIAGTPLPAEIFDVHTKPTISITATGRSARKSKRKRSDEEG